MYFFANVRHVQWAIPQICSEGSMFIPLHFNFSSITLEGILCDGRHALQVWQKRITVTNAQTVRGRPIRSNHLQTHRLFVVDPHQNTKMSVHIFRKGSFRDLLANISNVAIKLLQVLKRSVEQSVQNMCKL